LLEAALESVTVQVDAAPELSVEGEQASEVRVAGALSVIVAVLEAPLSVAVTVADPSVEKLPAVAEKVADDWPPDTMTDVGTTRFALLLDRETVVLLGAIPVSVAVQVEAPPGPKVVGLQLKEESAGGGAVTVTVPPLAVIGIAIPVPEEDIGDTT